MLLQDLISLSLRTAGILGVGQTALPQDLTDLLQHDARGDIAQAIERVRGEAGVFILTDMFGGTPSNLAISVMEQTKAEVIAGLNLPMLIKLAKSRDLGVPEAVAAALDAGRKYINSLDLGGGA